MENCNVRVGARHLKTVIGIASILMLVLMEIGTMQAQEVKQPWKAPGSAVRTKNPVKPGPDTLKAAAMLYQQNCVVCHGKTGASNGPAAGSLPEKPANFTDANLMRKATDGELFWKISTGRAPMPSWQDHFSETQRWELVNYLRVLTKEGRYKYLGHPN
jgi:mono/diheme cytochrome c family protein